MPAPAHYTDLWNARQFVAAHGAEVRWTAAGGWAAWDGARWVQGADNAVMRRAKATVDGLYARAEALPDARDRAALIKWAVQSEGADRLGALVRLARSEPGIEAPGQWDTAPWLLNCPNGTLDLRTGHLRPATPADHLTRVCPVAYDPAAPCPRWLTFLDRVLGHDPALVAFVARAVGYTLTGFTTEQVLFFCYGAGRNGKSTFVETLQALCGHGEYAYKIPMEALLSQRSPAPPWVLAELPGVRLVVGSEVEADRALNEALIKDLTGGDRINACRKFHQPFTFAPQFTLWLYGNHRPALKTADAGIRRRLVLLPFTQTIPLEEQDRNLGATLRAELPGILAWAVRGCSAWQAEGLAPPSAVQAATGAYLDQQDGLSAWLAQATAPGPGVPLNRLYMAWVEAGAVHGPESARALARALQARGYRVRAGAGNVRIVDGLQLQEVVA